MKPLYVFAFAILSVSGCADLIDPDEGVRKMSPSRSVEPIGRDEASFPEKTVEPSQETNPLCACSTEERDYWDRRISACTGPWVYKAYDCFQLKQGAECGLSHYETKPVIGVLSCEHPDHGAVSWKKVYLNIREITWLQLANYQVVVDADAKRLFGPQALGGYEIVGTDFEQIRACLSTQTKQDHEGIDFVEHYYHRNDGGEWVEQAQVASKVILADFIFKQSQVMENARVNLPEGFGRSFAIGANRLPALLSRCAHNFVTVREEYYAPAHYEVKQNAKCGTGEIGRELDHAHPVYHACRLPHHGRATTNECEAPETAVLSGLNLRRDELPGEHDYATGHARCSTDDALDESSAPSQRLAAFYAVSMGQQGDGRGPLHADLDKEAIQHLALRKAKYTFERFVDAISEEQRVTMRDVYKMSPHTNACGASAAGITDDLAAFPELSGLISLCHRLSLDHVGAQGVQHYLRTCLSPHLGRGEEATLKMHLRQLAGHSYAMLEKFISHAQAEGIALCSEGGSDAAEMIEEWSRGVHHWYDGDEAYDLRERLMQKLADQCSQAVH
jgi:hypothetical protein